MSTESNADQYTMDKTVIYVFSRGEITTANAYQLPWFPQTRERKWFLPDKGETLSNVYASYGKIGFATKQEAVEYLEKWIKQQREAVTRAYRWMADHAMESRS